MSGYFESIKQYVDFTDEDTRRLQALAGPAESYLVGFSEHFYERIAQRPDALRVFSGPEQIERLKLTLVEWMRSGLAGPHDEAFFERRSRIGRVHVAISLPQKYMFTAMNVMRLDFHHMIATVCEGDVARERQVRDSVDKLFDLELAIMLHTYQEDSEERLRRHERLATIGQVAGSIGHDLRNPLSVIQSSLYILSRLIGDDARGLRHVERIRHQVSLCDGIIRNLLQLARNRPPRRSLIGFEEVFHKACSSLTVPPGIDVQLTVADGVVLYADAGLLGQALSNLIDNAVKAYGREPGVIRVTVHSDREDHVLIEVVDEGPGFSAEAIARVFEPLVTTRDNGTGLGLALVKGITERHGGTVVASNRPEGGASVRLRLPVSAETSLGSERARVEVPRRGETMS